MKAASLDRLREDMRRGACPALSAPMMTGDGLLARIALTDAISPADLAEVCRLAMTHGNGMLDISARGNLQVRGLTEASAPALDADIRRLNLPLRDGLAVEVPPLAGLDPSEIADPRPLAEAIGKAARDIAGLAPKMTVVVDGHGQLRHAKLLADIRLVAVEKGRWKLLLGDTEDSASIFNVLRETLVVDAVLDLLKRLAALGNMARGRDLAEQLSVGEPAPASAPSSSGLSRGSSHVDANEQLRMLGTSPSMTAGDGDEALLSDSRLVARGRSPADGLMRNGGAEDEALPLNSRLVVRGRSPAGGLAANEEVAAFSTSSSGLSRGSTSVKAVDPDQMLGTSPSTTAGMVAGSPFHRFRLRDGLHAIGIGPAFGQARAEDLIALCDVATRLGVKAVRPAFAHSLLFSGSDIACEALRDFAGEHGFIVSAGDPRGHIAACPGSPACNSATIATHEIAARAASECGDLLDGSFTLHVTGCPKGCAHPQAAALALCGTEAGVALIADGKAAGGPFAFTAFADTNATLRRLADLVTSERRPGENSAACLARIGSARLAAAATGRP
jgi:precorrin-3B synthase